MSVINATPLLLGGEGYQISRSVRLRSSASAYFNRTPASAGNRKTWTWSGWHKRGALQDAWFLGADDGTLYSQIQLLGDYLRFGHVPNTGGTVYGWRTQAVFRDPSAWYHIVFAIDTTQATAANRIRIYVNGVEQTSLVDATGYGAIPQNTDTFINAALSHMVGRFIRGANNQMDGYLTEVNFIDGQALTPSSFGETDSITGVWKPKKYAGTYGTNGFYLNFSDNSSNTATTIGKDNSGNGNNWTPNNISVTAGVTYDSMLDVPTLYADGGNGRGNYAVLNPLEKRTSGVSTTSNANLSATLGNSGSTEELFSTLYLPTSGKWYWEVTPTTATSNTRLGICRAQDTTSFFSASYLYDTNGNKWLLGSSSAYGATYTSNDVIGFAYDADAQTLVAYKNNTSQGTLASGLSNANGYKAAFFGNATVIAANFGQRPFAYTPPTGFKALNTQNLPEPTIKKGNQFFDATLWTGNGTSQSIVNNGGFAPDLVWFKSRSSGALWNVLCDTSRGATKELYSNSTSAETTDVTDLTAFNSNGFSVGSGNGANQNSGTYVAWQWKESPSAGFDIVTYTGNGGTGASSQAVAHSLGVPPSMAIIKSRNTASTNWTVEHIGCSAGGRALVLNTTNAVSSAFPSEYRFDQRTSSTYQVGVTTGGSTTNASGQTYVMYLFAEVAGFSKAFSYTGNGSADGPFIFCGFRPRYVMIKRTDSTGDWFVFDTARNTFNTISSFLRPNWSDAEATNTNHSIDLLSNGFKSRAVDTGVNASGGTYIGFAFAESPFRNSLAR